MSTCALLACSAVDIRARCAADDGATRLDALPTVALEDFSVGVVGDFTFLERSTMVTGVSPAFVGQWYGVGFRPTGAQRSFGFYGEATRWSTADGRLFGTAWMHPSPPTDPLVDLRVFTISDAPADVDATLSEVATHILPPLATFGGGIAEGLLFTDAGNGLLPQARADGRSLFAYLGVPLECGDGGVPYYRLYVYSPGDAAGKLVEWGSHCALDQSAVPASPWIVSGATGQFVVLFHTPDSYDAQLKAVGIDVTGTLAWGPKRVGFLDPDGIVPFDGYFQARAALLPGGRIVFAERHDSVERCAPEQAGPHCPAPRWLCYGLRIMDTNGDNAHDAPWQLPCLGGPEHGDVPVTSDVELEAVPGGAILAWTERSTAQLIGTVVDWHEAVHAVFITPEGKRGSEILTVTDPDATAVDWSVPRSERTGPPANDFSISLSMDGDHGVIGWTDRRTTGDGPGIYARHIHCAPPP